MKKITLILAAIFFLLSTSVVVVDAKGHGGGPGRSCTIIVKKEVVQEVVFNVTPEQFRKVDDFVSETYPDYKCNNWYYDFNFQHYQKNCKLEKSRLFINLKMDGSVNALSKEGKKRNTKTIGTWDE